ncbi:FecR domain-containing protein [Dongia sp.]|uniref:FecR family protein n=1 Tax=Dongia sp. TaxID=1977262 RepID=UPI0035B09F31
MKGFMAPAFGVALLTAASAIALAATQETPPVAEVVDVVKNAFHTPPGGNEAAANIGDKLMADEAIRTGADSAIEMSFPDGATLRLEADSDLVLDSYVFDPTALKSAANINIPSGIARYTTGETSTDDTGVAFNTPVATVGIRGTDIVVSVGANGATVIDVLSGKVNAKPINNSTAVDALEGQSILVGNANEEPKVGNIGDFSTAAGPAPAAPGPTNTGDDASRGATKRSASNAPSSSNAGGNSGGDNSGGGNSGGENSGGGNAGGSDSDGDGNNGHGDNPSGHDNDNPGKGGGGGGGGKGGGKGNNK